MNKFLLSALLFTAWTAHAQCDSVNIQGDLIIDSDALMSGVYVIQGEFRVESGVTVFVTPYGSNSCGKLKIYAGTLQIDGTINADFAGYEGGQGGLKGSDVTSATGNGASLTTCASEGSAGHISVAGGLAGSNGQGAGAGQAGNDGNDGAGTKQYCGNFGDEAGLVGGAGGAGGGGGASYGGNAGSGAFGGSGSNLATTVSMTIEDSYPTIGGAGGMGGSAGSSYGTEDGRDIQLGSGGAGGGGGGRSYYLGTDGSQGGNGGGLVFLKANNSLEITGLISANGEDGSYGGNGGSGDATVDCCSDGCSGCDESTFSCGAGAGSGSGAGSGGGIFIESLGTIAISGTLEAAGGNGGTSGQLGTGVSCEYEDFICSDNSILTADGASGGAGGAGGGGRIKIYYADCGSLSMTGTINTAGGIGNQAGTSGTYYEFCGYAQVPEFAGEFIVSLAPNPFRERIELNTPNVVLEKYTIISSLGNCVQTGIPVSSKVELDLSHLENGVYFVTMEYQGTVITRKIIKQ